MVETLDTPMNEKVLFPIVFLPFVFWFIFLYLKKYPFLIEYKLKKNHLLQPLAATCIYFHWGQYFPGAYTHTFDLLPQFLFAYLLKIHLSWSRRKKIVLDFGPIPIVFSLNFFLWFPIENFYLYFVLIFISLVSKEFICWKNKSGSNHIFNPSAISAFLLICYLIITKSYDITLAGTVSSTLNIPPYMFELLFFIGIFINFFIPILWVSLGAVLALTIIYYVPLWVLNYTFHGVPFDVPIFLGITLLITDPSTTPKSEVSSFLFGVLYGISIFIAAELLLFIKAPIYFDKLLFVPLLNLFVPWFNKLGETINDKIFWGTIKITKIQLASIYGVLFFLILPSLKKIYFKGI